MTVAIYNIHEWTEHVTLGDIVTIVFNAHSGVTKKMVSTEESVDRLVLNVSMKWTKAFCDSLIAISPWMEKDQGGIHLENPWR